MLLKSKMLALTFLESSFPYAPLSHTHNFPSPNWVRKKIFEQILHCLLICKLGRCPPTQRLIEWDGEKPPQKPPQRQPQPPPQKQPQKQPLKEYKFWAQELSQSIQSLLLEQVFIAFNWFSLYHLPDYVSYIQLQVECD